jgi:6,7-dimethyl-8-ribityllumazine synthase
VREDIAAVLCLGLVLKGETTHDQYIARAASLGIAQVALATDKPVLFGVLTCDTLEQARARALSPEQGGTHDKGREVARAAIETLEALESTKNIGKQARRMGFGAPAGSSEVGA